MKTLFYKIFALMFNLCRVFKINDGRVALLSPHNADFNDSLGEIENVLKKDSRFQIVRISGRDLKSKSVFRAIRFFTVNAFYLATSKYIFMNDNFMPMANLNFSKDAVITQLWHAEGAFKKFGQALCRPANIREREIMGNNKLSYVVCSSADVAPIYAQAFGVSPDCVLPLGSPRTDFFFQEHDTNKLKDDFIKQHPECAGKKLILYAPTFRDDPADDKKLLDSFDFQKFNAVLGDKYSLLLRLHPQVHSSSTAGTSVTNVTNHKNVSELVLICDVLITDYSSICMDFALINKPIFFYAFDLDKYNVQRQFYFDYEQYVPGTVSKSFEELLDNIKSNRYADEKLQKFKSFNFGDERGNAAQRVIENIVGKH